MKSRRIEDDGMTCSSGDPVKREQEKEQLRLQKEKLEKIEDQVINLISGLTCRDALQVTTHVMREITYQANSGIVSSD